MDLFPSVAPQDPESADVPFLGLINPHSGNRMGTVILEAAQRDPCYAARFFNIIEVATNPDKMEAFRQQVEVVRRETQEKMRCQPDETWRPRLLCGGGDGTASFAIWCFFRALCRDDGSCLWSDDELSCFFPAFVQLPLGTGNDFAGVLGWGRTIDPSGSPAKTKAWFTEALSQERMVLPFDVWGLFPRGDKNLKVCSLAGLDEKHPERPKFKTAGPSVLFLTLLYFSLGYEAFVASRVECNRTNSRLWNFKEYFTSGLSTLVGAERKNNDLTGVTACVPHELGMKQYFPPGGENSGPQRADSAEEVSSELEAAPREETPKSEFGPPRRTFEERNAGARGGHTRTTYESVGFMNIDSISGGMWSAQRPSSFNDGLVDLFRQRNYFGNLKRGCRFDTEKHSLVHFNIPVELPGVHCQSDGESRFLFNPDCGEVDLEVRRVMQIPVVIRQDFEDFPGAETPVNLQDNMHWTEVQNYGAPLTDCPWLPAASQEHLENCKAQCIFYGFAGFCVRDGRAQFWEGSPPAFKAALVESSGTTSHVCDYVRDGPQSFCFVGAGPKALEFRRRFQAWLAGELVAEMNATEEEVERIEDRANKYAQGICSRSQRVFMKFGKSVKIHICALCAKVTYNKGCRGCRRIFCEACFKKEHRGTAPNITWRYEDAGFEVARSLVHHNPLRYSELLSIDGAIHEMLSQERLNNVRPIRLFVWVNDEKDQEHVINSPQAACQWLQQLCEEQNEQENV